MYEGSNMARQWEGGHTAPVLCISAAGGEEGFVASGAEGGEVTVWTQEGTPVSNLRLSSGDDVTCVIFSPSSPRLLYASHGETVSVLDPRSLKEPVEELKNIGEDEINSLSINETGTFLALGDDSGTVRVVELQTGKVNRTLRRHTNICSSVAFRPQRAQNLVSAGLDMQVMLWNLQKTRPLWTFSLQDTAGEDDRMTQETPGQLFNPPLAHCITVASCGNVLACAAEDGCIHLARVGSGSRLERHSALKAHSQGASQTHFLNFMPHPYWLVSGGNDGMVALWDLTQEPLVAGEQKVKVQRKKVKKKNLKPETNGNSKLNGAEGTGEELPQSCNKVAPTLKLSHEQKVNWLCPALLKNQPSVLVADQSASLTVYPLTGI